MDNDKNLPLTCLGAVTLLVISVVGSVITTGLALSVLWSWYIVPIFNAPQISIAQAYGIVLCFAVTQRYQPVDDEQDSSKAILRLVTLVLIRPALLILSGWIIRGFM